MIGAGFSRNGRVEGVLYAEDFSIDNKNEHQKLETVNIEEEIKKCIFNEDDLLKARQQGILEGLEKSKILLEAERKKWESSIEKETSIFLEKISLSVESIIGENIKHVSSTIISSIIALFPSRLNAYGTIEISNLVSHLMPILKRATHISVTAAENEVGQIEKFCRSSGVTNIECILREDMAPGDFQISWPDGMAFRLGEELSAALLNSLLPLPVPKNLQQS